VVERAAEYGASSPPCRFQPRGPSFAAFRSLIVGPDLGMGDKNGWSGLAGPLTARGRPVRMNSRAWAQPYDALVQVRPRSSPVVVPGSGGGDARARHHQKPFQNTRIGSLPGLNPRRTGTAFQSCGIELLTGDPHMARQRSAGATRMLPRVGSTLRVSVPILEDVTLLRRHRRSGSSLNSCASEPPRPGDAVARRAANTFPAEWIWPERARTGHPCAGA